jgi:hypothetical protein
VGLNIGDIIVPDNYNDVLASPQRELWEEAMQREITSLTSLGVWEIVPRPPGKKIVRSKWVFVAKKNVDGSLNKLRARLVAVGSSQRPGVDYDQSFSPVVRAETVKLILAISAQRNYTVRTFDVSSAYVRSDLDSETYMQQPAGFCTGKEGDVCLLKNSLYVLSNAERC